jgi:hypothetical protein
LIGAELSDPRLHFDADCLPTREEQREVVSAKRDRRPAIGARVDVLDSWTLPVAPSNDLVVEL